MKYQILKKSKGTKWVLNLRLADRRLTTTLNLLCTSSILKET